MAEAWSLKPNLRTFLRGHGVKRRGLLFDILSPALGTPQLIAVMLVKGKNALKSLLAVPAEIVVDGHGSTSRGKLTAILPLAGKSRAVTYRKNKGLWLEALRTD